MSSYTQLTQGQRYQISALKKAGHTQEEIGEAVGTSESTISREVRRNRGPEKL
jgi:IS30 family transposase